MKLSLPPSEVRSLDSLVPYWRNPRRLSDEAVNAVAKSLTDYGYNQPIVVDGDGVIIIGHTRYSAMRRLGVASAPVVVVSTLPAEKVKQLRVLDNRAGEFTTWDLDALLDELGDSDAALAATWFPEIGTAEADAFADDAEADTGTGIDTDPLDTPAHEGTLVEFVCPSCLHMWERAVTRDQIMSGRIDSDDASSQAV
jgi:hypothetical protein